MDNRVYDEFVCAIDKLWNCFHKWNVIGDMSFKLTMLLFVYWKTAVDIAHSNLFLISY